MNIVIHTSETLFHSHYNITWRLPINAYNIYIVHTLQCSHNKF